MSLLLETVGFFLSTVGWALLAVTLFNSYWRVSSVSGNVITTSTIYENLWQSCATDSTGVHNCWEFQSLLELPAYLQASRALMISALVLGFLGILSSMLGLQCTKVAENNPNAKAKMAVVGGCLFILAGLCGMVTISWYAFNITRDFFNPLYAGIKYEIGPALYLGWSASLLVIIGGCFLFSSCRTNSSQDNSYIYPYKAPKSGMSAPNTTVSRPAETPTLAVRASMVRMLMSNLGKGGSGIPSLKKTFLDAFLGTQKPKDSSKDGTYQGRTLFTLQFGLS